MHLCTAVARYHRPPCPTLFIRDITGWICSTVAQPQGHEVSIDAPLHGGLITPSAAETDLGSLSNCRLLMAMATLDQSFWRESKERAHVSVWCQQPHRPLIIALLDVLFCRLFMRIQYENLVENHDWCLKRFSTFDCLCPMDEGRERDNTSRKGGLPTLPGLYHSTIQPSRRGFYMCVRGR